MFNGELEAQKISLAFFKKKKMMTCIKPSHTYFQTAGQQQKTKLQS